MDDPKQQQEPSMEEILASIRRIISDDETEGETEEAAEPEEAATEEPVQEQDEEPAEDVFELTQEIREDGSVVDITTGETIVEAEMPELVEDEVEAEPELEPELEPEPAPVPEPARAPEPEPVLATPPPVEEHLVGPPAETSSTSSFTDLASAVAAQRAGMGIGGRTIEDLCKEVMRPMIKEWLDQNLPDLVERLVAREIERMTRHAEDAVDR